MATGQVSIRKRLTKQIVVCLCNGKLSSEKEGLLAHTLTWMNLRIVNDGSKQTYGEKYRSVIALRNGVRRQGGQQGLTRKRA